MKKLLLPMFFVGTVALATSCGNNQTKDSTDVAEQKNDQKMDQKNTDSTKDDQNFMVDAASGGMMEVQLGNIAEQNAASPKVKDFGKMMVTDHTKANDELKALAASKNISIPPTPGEDDQKKIDNLKTEKGANFDKDYMSAMVDDHKKDIDKFQKEADNGKDAAIKAFAAKTLPVLKHHLEAAQSINDAMKK